MTDVNKEGREPMTLDGAVRVFANLPNETDERIRQAIVAFGWARWHCEHEVDNRERHRAAIEHVRRRKDAP